MKKVEVYRCSLEPDIYDEIVKLNLRIPLLRNQYQLTNDVISKLNKSCEEIFELNKFQGNLSLMGTMITQIIKNKKLSWNFRAFLILHPKESSTKDIFNKFISDYADAFKRFFNLEIPIDQKMVKKAMKAFDKQDPKRVLLQYLMNLKNFPDENITDLKENEYHAFTEFFNLIVASETNSCCPIDGEEIRNEHENLLGMHFCSKNCLHDYDFLIYNVIAKQRSLKFKYTYGWRPISTFEQSCNDNWGAKMPALPRICVYCGSLEDFPRENWEVFTSVETQSMSIQHGNYVTYYRRQIKFAWVAPICDACRNLIKEINFTKFGLRSKLAYKELRGIKLNNLATNFEVNGLTNEWVSFKTINRKLAWVIMCLNLERMKYDDILSMMVSFQSIDQRSAIDWLEHVHFKHLMDQIAFLLSLNHETIQFDKEVFAGLMNREIASSKSSIDSQVQEEQIPERTVISRSEIPKLDSEKTESTTSSSNCPSCGAACEENTEFCDKCGRYLV